jgi:hypothetical protein
VNVVDLAGRQRSLLGEQTRRLGRLREERPGLVARLGEGEREGELTP